MDKPYVIARKLKGGAVECLVMPSNYWVVFPANLSNKPDYRNKRVTINCAEYPIFWDKRGKP